MGKCCSVDRNELPDENVQIIRMKLPRKNINLEIEKNNNNQNQDFQIEKQNFNSEMASSGLNSVTNLNFNNRLIVKHENSSPDKNEYRLHEEIKENDEDEEIPDQDIREHVFS